MGRQLPGGPAAVTDRMLLRRSELGHRPAVVRPGVVGDERRVVAEATGSTRRVRQRALATALEDRFGAVLVHQGDGTDVGHPPILLYPDLLEQLGEVLLIGGVLPGVAGRAHPGTPAEPVGRDPRVIGDGRAPGRDMGGSRLPERVLL